LVIIKTLDPDGSGSGSESGPVFSLEILDPDPDSMIPDPKHWLTITTEKEGADVTV
jgi:hypothetical protein